MTRLHYQTSREVSEHITVSCPVRASYEAVSESLSHGLTEVAQLAFPSGKSPPFEATLTTVSLRGLFRVPVALEWSRRTNGDGALMHVTWRPRRLLTVLPVMEAELVARSESSSRSELLLVGSYKPPFGVLGLVADRFVGRIAVSTAEAFLEDLAAAIERHVHGQFS